MTIEELVSGKLKKAKIVGFMFWLAFAATMFFAQNANVFFFSLIPFAGFMGTIFYILFFIKCPRCGASLAQASMISSSLLGKKSKLNYCPNCGVSLSETA